MYYAQLQPAEIAKLLPTRGPASTLLEQAEAVTVWTTGDRCDVCSAPAAWAPILVQPDREGGVRVESTLPATVLCHRCKARDSRLSRLSDWLQWSVYTGTRPRDALVAYVPLEPLNRLLENVEAQTYAIAS